MESPYFKELAMASLDNDLQNALTNGKIKIGEAIALQQLRILRGRPINVVPMKSKGWSADGKTWEQKQPGA